MSLFPKSPRNNEGGFARTLRAGAGFLLLEVMLSVFIVVVGVVFIIGSFITSVKTAKVSRSYLDMLFLMEEQMWQYEESGVIEEGSDSGNFEGYKGAEWSVEAEESEDGLSLNETTVVVDLKNEEKKRSLKAVTYFVNKD